MKIMTIKIDVTNLSEQQAVDLECALVAQIEDLSIKNTVEIDDEEDGSMD